MSERHPDERASQPEAADVPELTIAGFVENPSNLLEHMQGVWRASGLDPEALTQADRPQIASSMQAFFATVCAHERQRSEMARTFGGPESIRQPIQTLVWPTRVKHHLDQYYYKLFPSTLRERIRPDSVTESKRLTYQEQHSEVARQQIARCPEVRMALLAITVLQTNEKVGDSATTIATNSIQELMMAYGLSLESKFS